MPYYGGGGTSLPVTDDTVLVQNSADTTKQIRFDVSSVSASTTRVYIMPNVDGTFALKDTDNGFSTGQSITSSSVGDVTLTLNAISGQTANLTEWYNTAGNLSAWVDKDGVPNFSSFPVISGITQGSVLFGGSGGIVAQDNTNLFWDDSSNLLTSNGVIVGNYSVTAKAPISGAGNSLTLAASAAVSGNTNGGDTIVQLTAAAGTGANGNFIVRSPSAVNLLTVSDSTISINLGNSSSSTLVFRTSSGKPLLQRFGQQGLFFDTNSQNILPAYANSAPDSGAYMLLGTTTYPFGGIALKGGYTAGVSPVTIDCGAATTTGIKLQLYATQTADAFQVLASDGVTKLASIDASGIFTGSGAGLTGIVGGSSGQLQYNNSGVFGGLASTAVSTSGNLITVTAQAATDVPLTLTGHASQTANLLTLKKGSSTVAYITGNGAITVPNSTSIATGFSFNGTRGIYCHSGTGDIIFDTNSGANATAVRPLYDNTATATLGTASYRWGGLYVGSANVVLGADVIGQKIVLYATQTADAFQVLASDGVTVGYGLDANYRTYFTPQTTPTAATDKVYISGADYTTADTRLLVTSESGTPLWVGNGAIEAKSPASGAGNSLTLAASAAVSVNTNGGNIILSPGAKNGTGYPGQLLLTGYCTNLRGCISTTITGDTSANPQGINFTFNPAAGGNNYPTGVVISSTASGSWGNGYSTALAVSAASTQTTGRAYAASFTASDNTSAQRYFVGTNTSVTTINGVSSTSTLIGHAVQIGSNIDGGGTLIGVRSAVRKGATTAAYGGYFSIDYGATPTSGFAALCANNGDSTYAVLLGLDNGVEVLRVADGGQVKTTLQADVIGQKIVLYSTQTADAFQVLASDGVTVLYKINKDGNPTVKSTVFFEDTNSYIYRTAAQNIMVFAPSSAVTSMQLSTGHLDVLTTYGLRLKRATDSADGEISAADKGGNSGTGLGLLLHGGAGSYSATPTAGGYIKVYGGDGAAGNTNGGSAYVFGGAKFGSGSDGDVHLGHTGSAMRGKVYLYTMVSPFVTPSSLTSDVNNYAPTLGKNYRLSTDGSNYTITGLSIGQVDGMEITLINTGSTGIITISDQDTNSTDVNRFLCASGASIQLDPNERCDLIYDGTTQRWRAF